jgi:hypothetical protein
MYLKAFLEIVIFLQKRCVVHDYLGIRDSEVHDLIVNSFRGFYRTNGLFKVDIERPQLQRLEKAGLR